MQDNKKQSKDRKPSTGIDADRAETLYDQYGKPLEQKHWGEYVAIFSDGRIHVGADLREVSAQALAKYGKGSIVFKVGDKAVGKWR